MFFQLKQVFRDRPKGQIRAIQVFLAVEKLSIIFRVESTDKKVLLFVTHVPENLKIVLSFLSKRNFSVFFETDIKSAVSKVFEIKPDFIFIAWDHKDKKIMMLPQLLEKVTSCTFVPFINKNSKESVFKFDSCPINPKLYPPISGPAIERLILKHSKEDEEYLKKVNKFKSMKSGSEEILSIENNLKQLAESTESEKEMFPPPPEDVDVDVDSKQSDEDFPKQTPTHISNPPILHELSPELEQLTQEIEARNELLDTPRVELTEDQKEAIRESLQQEIEEPLTNILQSREIESWDEDDRPPLAEAEVPTTPTIPEFSPAESDKKSEVSAPLQSPLFFSSSASPKAGGIAYTPDHSNSSRSSASESKSADYQVYCFSIVFENWCGYFVVATQAVLDYPTLDLVFTDWLKKQFPKLAAITERDFFEFNRVDFKLLQEVQSMAELTEKINANGEAFYISLFSVHPEDMKVEFNSEKNYIRLFTQDLPTDLEIDFNLYLHLPENQKYLLYTQKNRPLTLAQKDRLLNKNVTQLYTSINCEQEYRRFLLRRTFTRLYELINNRLTLI